jgi:hypothetical protein
LSAAELNTLTTRIGSAFASEVLAIVDFHTRGRRLQARQAIAIMRACTFESTRIDVALLLRSRLTASDHAAQLVEGFAFASSARTYQTRSAAAPGR